MIKLILAFALFAGLVYYYNVDIIALVDKSGAPEWLAKKGYNVKVTSTSTPSTVSTGTSSASNGL